jgi:PKD repeat protein
VDLVDWEEGSTTLQPSIWGREVQANKTMDAAFEIRASTVTDLRNVPALASGAPGPYIVAWAHTRGGGSSLLDLHGRLVGNTRPTAAFTVSPTSGDTGTLFHFDASGCTDGQDPAADLEVCWDWDNDGNCDEPWSKTKTISMKFSLPGTVSVRLQVRDRGGLTHSTTHQITVEPPSVIITYSTFLPMVGCNFK